MATSSRAFLLSRVAAETKAVLPKILSQVPTFDAKLSSVHDFGDTVELDPAQCPGYTLPEGDPEAGTKGTRIRVYDQDSFNAALQLQPGTNVKTTTPPAEASDSKAPEDAPSKPLKPVAVLNLASERHPGGGWQKGALAQEEALCFRSSLYLSLHRTYYPLPSQSTIYSPNVLLIRNALTEGHQLYSQDIPVSELPITSVISVAGIRHPAVSTTGRYRWDEDREITKNKIRCVLRVAAQQGHSKLVLGALGCGVFGNPPTEVANCFLDVFKEEEFQGGWWEDIVFAVLDNARGPQRGKDGAGNFGLFYRALDGKVV